MKRIFPFISLMVVFITCILFTACRKEKDPVAESLPNPPPCWEKFVGTYTVYDTANNTSYTMEIEHFSTPNSNGGMEDTLVLTNFANRFDFKYHFNCGWDANYFNFFSKFPTYDHNNKRWALFSNNDDTTTTFHENLLQNDTILLYFKMDNIAFFYYDSVPYYSANLKHIAVKQH